MPFLEVDRKQKSAIIGGSCTEREQIDLFDCEFRKERGRKMNTPRPEYPRPRLVRDEWMNLNGTWQFEFDFGDSGKWKELWKEGHGTFDKEILVPFVPESKLSGIEYTDFFTTCWYKRSFELPANWDKEQGRILLNFGAVDFLAEVWVNELRLSDFDNKGGWAANARITAKLADVATISFAGSRMTPGFGSIEQHAAEIEREDFRSIDFSTSVEFGKFFPERWRLRIPMYYAYSRQSTLPEYDPLDSDIPLEVALDNAANRHLRDSIKRNAEDYVMRKSLNFTNVGIESKDGKSHFFDWSNLSLTYSYNKSFARNVNLERDLEKNYRGLISYIYNGMPPIVEPFKKSKSKTLNSKYLRLIKDFNFYYMPSMFSITSDITRNYREVKSKNLDNPNLLIEPTYDKDFMWTRDYAFKFNLTRNLVVDFHATTQARIDEPEGIVDRQRDPERYQQWKDTVWNNILDGGRPVNYNHDFSVQYTVPVNKLPFLDWTSLQLGYSTRYDWQAAAVTADSTNLGNVIRNASALQMNGDLSLTSLYNKSKFLREMIRPPRKQRGKNVKFETGMDKVQKGKPVVVRHRLKTGDIQARLTAADGKNIKLGYESVGRNKIRINSSETLEGGKLLVTGTETPHAGVGNAVARFFCRDIDRIQDAECRVFGR